MHALHVVLSSSPAKGKRHEQVPCRELQQRESRTARDKSRTLPGMHS